MSRKNKEEKKINVYFTIKINENDIQGLLDSYLSKEEKIEKDNYLIVI